MEVFDLKRFNELHIVRKIREQIRKWWGVEIAFADRRGYVAEHAKGMLVLPRNKVCRTSLAARDGFAHCNRSVQQAVKSLMDMPEGKAQVMDTCHLGFPIVMVPVVIEEVFYGAIFTCGFLRKGESGSREKALMKARALGLNIEDEAAHVESIPRLSDKDVNYLCDLLETTVAEIIEFTATLKVKEERILQLTTELGDRYQFGDIVGKSPPMKRMFALLDKVVYSQSTVLIQGENGTGKELVARGLHYNGPRKKQQFVVQNCSALNDNLLESELFGHVRGAFTGATKDKKGMFEIADGGTFFLDEIGDTSPAMQVKLLRVLQEGTFIPVGDLYPRKVDVRVATATNRNLKKMMARHEFREDLYYRLNVINIVIPPLRDRLDDLPILCDHFLAKHATKSGRAIKRLSPEIMARFYDYNWPGNIRELENEIERLIVLSGNNEEITPEFLMTGGAPFVNIKKLESFRAKGTLEAAVRALERDMIQHGLVKTHWNKTKLARKLGISRTTLIKKIKVYGLEDEP